MDYYNNVLKKDTFIKSEMLCPICKWNLIDCINNFTDNVTDIMGENTGDRFIYCANKGCDNHGGVYYEDELDKLDLLLKY